MRVTKKEWLRSGIVLVMLAGTMGITVPVMAETTVLTEDTTQGRLACESGTDKQNPKIIDMNGYNLSIRGEENNGILNSIHIGNNQYLSVKIVLLTKNCLFLQKIRIPAQPMVLNWREIHFCILPAP